MNNNFEIKVFNNGSVSVEVNFDKENSIYETIYKVMGSSYRKED